MSTTNALAGKLTTGQLGHYSLWTRLGQDRWLRFWLLIPTVLILLLLSVYPLIYAAYISLFNYRFGKLTNFIGLGNYQKLLGDVLFWESIKVTLIFAAVVVVVEFVLGLILALLLTEEVRFRTFYRTALIIPMVLAPVVVGIIFRLLYDTEFGLPDYIVKNVLHMPIVDWLGNPNLSLFSLMLMDIWQWTPFMFIVLLAGLQSIPLDLYEAARVDGATFWQEFVSITLPMLRPTILVALLVRTMDAMRLFDQVFVLTQGGPGTTTEVLSFHIYQTAFKFTQLTYGAALLMVVLVITLIISTIYIRLLRSQSE
jgi:multiple sugar transport system permease protein